MLMTPLVRAALLITSLLSAVEAATTIPAPNAPVTAVVNGVSYVWKGMVAYGELSPELVDQFGDTIGGIGSAASVKYFKKNADGTYSGTIVAQPDRGHNTVNLNNYYGRRHNIGFTLNPCTTATCNAAGTPSLTLTYLNSLRYKDTSALNMNGGFTTGLDPDGMRAPSGFFPVLPQATSNGAITLDAEGLALMADGTSWVSDEYGPTIYHVAADGTILSAIDPPAAILPHLADGALAFETTGTTTTYGRVANQGFEALCINPANNRLYTMLQSATSQDQNLAVGNRQYTRMLVYDITIPNSPSLIEQYVVELPGTADHTTIFAQSEMYYVSPGVFMLLARDGKGDGNGSSTSKLTSVFKNIGLFTTNGATQINGRFDAYNSAVAPAGVLDPTITAAQFVEFVNLIDPTQLSKFGLHNGIPMLNDIVGKFESIALEPCLDPANPDDYFLFTLADNDFISLNEVYNGQQQAADPYGKDVPNSVFVARVTLPGADVAKYLLDASLNPSGLARRNRKRNVCPSSYESCSLGGGRFECVDTQSDLEQCGACQNDGGVDCSAMAGALSVECVSGACVADACADGSSLADGVCY